MVRVLPRCNGATSTYRTDIGTSEGERGLQESIPSFWSSPQAITRAFPRTTSPISSIFQKRIYFVEPDFNQAGGISATSNVSLSLIDTSHVDYPSIITMNRLIDDEVRLGVHLDDECQICPDWNFRQDNHLVPLPKTDEMNHFRCPDLCLPHARCLRGSSFRR